MVDVTGTVQASFNGTGQYVGAQQGRHGDADREQQFTAGEAGNGQWRITEPAATSGC